MASATWIASSRVGARTRACTRESAASTAARRGRPKAAVLPVPVWATPVMSRPASSGGIAAAWMPVGVSKPSAATAASRSSGRPRSAKVGPAGVVAAGEAASSRTPAGASSRASVREEGSEDTGVTTVRQGEPRGTRARAAGARGWELGAEERGVPPGGAGAVPLLGPWHRRCTSWGSVRAPAAPAPRGPGPLRIGVGNRGGPCSAVCALQGVPNRTRDARRDRRHPGAPSRPAGARGSRGEFGRLRARQA